MLLFAVVTIASALLVSNVVLVRRNRELNQELSSENHTLLPPMGHIVPPLRGFDPAGHALTLAYGRDPRPTLLFVLSPHCEFCSATWPAWERVLARVDINEAACRARPASAAMRRRAAYCGARSLGMANAGAELARGAGVERTLCTAGRACHPAKQLGLHPGDGA